MRASVNLAALFLCVVLTACNNSSSGNCFSPTGPNSALCVSCFTTQCGDMLTTCYGADWPTDNLNGGTCAIYGQCIQNCGCGNPNCPDKVCNQACLFSCASPTSACQSCLTMADACRQQQCGASCKDPNDTDAGVF